ncbi:MAG TPA: sigma-54 dependent transcriptional regulator [Geobacteraceae bacterium]|nr:sigma-54 dependent transcriptional regulator [Geobacteraceae bacterium]
MNNIKNDKIAILVVDDEENLRHMLFVLLSKQGYQVDLACNGEEALKMALSNEYNFILSDIKMPVMDGAEFLDKAFAAGIQSTVIMMSAYGTMDTAIECMKQGAYDYVSKPFKNDEILLVLKKAAEREKLKAENRRLKEELKREFSFSDIVSRNQRMQEIFALIRKVSDFKTTVLILGESGTGKELIAKALHIHSKRKNAPFVAVNCGAIPHSLLESELFGHVKGAFTDASTDKAGLFEQANGGTLFLDEIGEMPLLLQVKLLRVLQDEEIRPVGSSSVKKINVRVVSATAKDLEREVTSGRFREDLYFRLNVLGISLPPLRERSEDIPLLADHFLAKYGERFGKGGVRLSQNALRTLVGYQWPGNVRELENCIERGLLLCDGDLIDVDSLPESIVGRSELKPDPAAIMPEILSIKKAEEILERELIKRALEKTGGNRTHAARLLEISHRSLLYKLKEYEME